MQNAKRKMTTLYLFNVILSEANDLRLLRLVNRKPVNGEWIGNDESWCFYAVMSVLDNKILKARLPQD